MMFESLQGDGCRFVMLHTRSKNCSQEKANAFDHPPPKKPASLPTAERLAVSKKEAAVMLGVSERSLDHWGKVGKIRATKAGTRVLFPV